MLKDMERLLAENEELTADDLQRAAAQLLARQFLYRFRNGERASYLIVSEHRAYFERLMHAAGYRLSIDEDYQTIGIIPLQAFRSIRLADSLLLLTLRQVYEEEMRAYQSSEGVVRVTYERVASTYQQLTGRQAPGNLSQMKDWLELPMRHGIVKQPAHTLEPELEILPGILSLINAETLGQMLEQYRGTGPEPDAADGLQEEEA